MPKTKLEMKEVFLGMVKYIGYITKSATNAFMSYVWFNVAIYFIKQYYGGYNINGESSLIFIGLLCYEFYTRKWMIKE